MPADIAHGKWERWEKIMVSVGECLLYALVGMNGLLVGAGVEKVED